VSDDTAPGEINGIVTDVDGHPLGGVLVTIQNNTKGRTGSLTTQSSGRYRFIPIDPGIPFELGFVKRGYFSEVRSGVSVESNDEVAVNVQLHPSSSHQLAAVKIVAAPPKGSALAKKIVGSDELVTANVPNLLDALQRLRPMMLQPQHSLGFCRDSLSLYVDGIRRPVFDPPADSYDSTQARTWHKPLSQIAFERELQWLRPGDIAQVRFISCDDYDPEITQRNVIWVVTKRAAAAAADMAQRAADDSTRDAARRDSTPR